MMEEGMTPSHLAHSCNADTETILAILTQDRQPDRAAIAAFAKVFNISIEQLTKGTSAEAFITGRYAEPAVEAMPARAPSAKPIDFAQRDRLLDEIRSLEKRAHDRLSEAKSLTEMLDSAVAHLRDELTSVHVCL